MPMCTHSCADECHVMHADISANFANMHFAETDSPKFMLTKVSGYTGWR